MAWNPSPKVAEARKYGQKFDQDMVIIVGINPLNGSFEVISFGKTKALCDKAKNLGKAFEEAIKDVWNQI